MRKALLKLLAKSPESFQEFVAGKAIKYIFRNIVHIDVEGRENLPALDETVIFICNHLSNVDGPCLNEVLKEYAPTFVAGQKLSNDLFTGLFKKVFKSINIKPNSPDKAAMKEIIHLLRSGNNVVIFPEGTRSRSGAMIEGKRGILLMAKLAKVRIVPLAMTGTEKILPIDKGGNMTGEKLHKGNVLVKIGKPFSLPEKNEEQSKDDFDKSTMDQLMKSIANMLPEEYRGVYQ